MGFMAGSQDEKSEEETVPLVKVCYSVVDPITGDVGRKTSYVCKGCDHECSPAEMNEHMRLVHHIHIQLPMDEYPIIKKRTYILTDCGLRRTVYVCPDCGLERDTVELAEEHLECCTGPAHAPPPPMVQAPKPHVRKVEADSEDLDHNLETQQIENQDGLYARRVEALDRFCVVSLGSFCRVKQSIQVMGLGTAHMPFDWMRTTLRGVRTFVAEGFESFFSVASVHKSATCTRIVHRAENHSFWHDDISKPEAREKLRRRIARFEALASDSKDLFFVIHIYPSELGDIPDLYQALCKRFVIPGSSHQVLLSVLLSGQPYDLGPVTVKGLPNVVFFSVEAMRAARSETAYIAPIASALDLALEAGRLPGFGLEPAGESLSAAFPELRQGSSDRFGQLGQDSYFPAFEEPGADHFDLSTNDS